MPICPSCCCCCVSPKEWKVGLYSKTIALFINAAFVLSILSSFDCRFIEVDVGFVPDGSVFSTSTFCLGIWSLQDPNHNYGLDMNKDAMDMEAMEAMEASSVPCLGAAHSRQYGDLAGNGHDFYGPLIVLTDPWFAAAQIAAFIAMTLGLINAVLSLKIAFFQDYARPYNLTLLTIICFTMEGLKLGSFFDISPCTSSTLWSHPELFHSELSSESLFYPESLESSSLSSTTSISTRQTFQAEQCLFRRGSYMSLASIVLSFLAALLLLGNVLFPLYKSQGEMMESCKSILERDDTSRLSIHSDSDSEDEKMEMRRGSVGGSSMSSNEEDGRTQLTQDSLEFGDIQPPKSFLDSVGKKHRMTRHNRPGSSGGDDDEAQNGQEGGSTPDRTNRTNSRGRNKKKANLRRSRSDLRQSKLLSHQMSAIFESSIVEGEEGEEEDDDGGRDSRDGRRAYGRDHGHGHGDDESSVGGFSENVHVEGLDEKRVSMVSFDC